MRKKLEQIEAILTLSYKTIENQESFNLYHEQGHKDAEHTLVSIRSSLAIVRSLLSRYDDSFLDKLV